MAVSIAGEESVGNSIGIYSIREKNKIEKNIESIIRSNSLFFFFFFL